MSIFYILSLWLHIMAAITWVGGMMFLVIILVPTIRRPELREHSLAVIQISGEKFKRVGWACLLILVVTGLGNLHFRGLDSMLTSADFWQSPTGTLLAIKLVIVTLILTLSALHDFWIGPKAVSAWKANPEASETARLRKAASWMGRVNFLLSIVVVTLGIMLFRGVYW